MANIDGLSADLFENTALLFFEALRVSSLPISDRKRFIGSLDSGVLWELCSDLSKRGNELLSLFSDRFTQFERGVIEDCVRGAMETQEELKGVGGGVADRKKLSLMWSRLDDVSMRALRTLEPRIKDVYGGFGMDLSWYRF